MTILSYSSTLFAEEIPPSHTTPRADSRGFVNVWQLRKDVSTIEALTAYDNEEQCHSEGDPDQLLSEKELQRIQQNSEVCIGEVKRAYGKYVKLKQTLNDVWLPILYSAIDKGDEVAEVIMRQCETTHVLMRNGIESTCDSSPVRRRRANQRLLEIGFIPAVDISEELLDDRGNSMAQRGQNQIAVMAKIKSGALGYNRSLINMNGNTADDKTTFDNYFRWSLMEAIFQDAPRAFTFSPGYAEAGWLTSEFTTLRLNRKPLTPGYLTRGPRLHYGGGRSIYTGPYYWRFGPLEIYVSGNAFSTKVVAGPRNLKFLQQREKLLAEIESNIDAYLSKEPRWAVFLLQRIGHHEWVPEGTSSETSKINYTWLGDWALTDVFNSKRNNWIRVNESSNKTKARVSRKDGATFIALESDKPLSSPIADTSECQLRYSGGLTYLPAEDKEAAMSRETVLGYLSTYPIEGLSEPLKPLHPKKRYKQVLMHCPEGESLDNQRTRYLLLAGETMIEVASDKGAIEYIRHFKREDID
ncbi:MAG: hypothetical protein P8163_19720 [Candidatus Thiodiazotropha sp.]